MAAEKRKEGLLELRRAFQGCVDPNLPFSPSTIVSFHTVLGYAECFTRNLEVADLEATDSLLEEVTERLDGHLSRHPVQEATTSLCQKKVSFSFEMGPHCNDFVQAAMERLPALQEVSKNPTRNQPNNLSSLFSLSHPIFSLSSWKRQRKLIVSVNLKKTFRNSPKQTPSPLIEPTSPLLCTNLNLAPTFSLNHPNHLPTSSPSTTNLKGSQLSPTLRELSAGVCFASKMKGAEDPLRERNTLLRDLSRKSTKRSSKKKPRRMTSQQQGSCWLGIRKTETAGGTTAVPRSQQPQRGLVVHSAGNDAEVSLPPTRSLRKKTPLQTKDRG